MAEVRESFLYKELPVVPCNSKDDSWFIYSPKLKKKVKVKGRESFNTLLDKTLEKREDFLKIDPNRDDYIELYITKETSINNLKKSVIAGVNRSLEKGSKNLGVNIFWNSTYQELIIETLKLINSLTVGVLDTETYITLTSPLSEKSLETLNSYNVHYYISLTPETMEAFIKSGHYFDRLNKTVLSITIDKNSIFRLSDLIEVVALLGIKKVYVDYTKKDSEKPMKEIFVLNLLKAIKTGSNSGIEVVNRAFSRDYPIKLITTNISESAKGKCRGCFAKNMCNSNNDFDCYITTNVLPAIIKSN